VLLFLFDALAQFDWLRSTALLFVMLRVAGMGLIVVCGALAFGQRNWGRLAGYAVLVEWGAILLAVGMRTPVALEAAAALLVMRVPALAVWAAGAGALAGGGATDEDSLRSRAHAQPFATLAALAGGLSLAGLPLTAGFAVRWTVLRMVAVQEFWLAAALVFAGLGVLVAHVRLLRALFEAAPQPPPETEPESAVLAGLALLGAGAVLGLGFNPQWLVPAATRMVEALAGKLG
jgi:formate hydrogenlyase subunit 3/multisubunit Na+/H+ antiporter MnhD subunit